jgi:hypothetical protein
MKQATQIPDNQDEIDESEDTDMLEEYDFSAAMPNKCADHYAAGSNLVRLAPDVAAQFPDSATVNEALRLLIRLAQQEVKNVPPTDES